MDEKIYECNAELEAVLKRFGFIEVTSRVDQIKGKKEFRKGRSSETLIRFDYINFKLFEGIHGCRDFGGSRIPAADLRLFLWYLGARGSDKQEISGNFFELGSARSAYQSMKKTLDIHKELGLSNPKSRKIERLVNNYSLIRLN